MLKWFRQLDDILRGETTRLPALADGRMAIPVGGLTVVIVLLGAFYGACIGCYSLIRGGDNAAMQLVASAVKLPMLFLLTLFVTLPSLYTFSALVGSQLKASSVLRLLIAATGVMLAVLASLGPIVVFFALSTTSYPFMILLNVATGTVAGSLGLGFLLRTLHRLMIAQEPVTAQSVRPNDEASKTGAAGTSALDMAGRQTDRRAQRVFNIWTIVFALVGAQMSWVLRPFIGSPGMPFHWFRHQEGNFFIAVFRALGHLLS
jgi:hypothetical protein